MALFVGILSFPAYGGDAGEDIYKTYCWNCHGIDGFAEIPDVIPSFAKGERLYKPDVMLFYSIWNGTKGRVLPMPAWKDRLSEEEVWQVIRYIRATFGRHSTQEAVR